MGKRLEKIVFKDREEKLKWMDQREYYKRKLKRGYLSIGYWIVFSVFLTLYNYITFTQFYFNRILYPAVLLVGFLIAFIPLPILRRHWKLVKDQEATSEEKDYEFGFMLAGNILMVILWIWIIYTTVSLYRG